MPEPVSALTLAAGYTLLTALTRSNNALSSEAQWVQERASIVRRTSERSVVLFGDKERAISDLLTLQEECSQPDWDGSGAEPLRAEAVTLAADLIRALPADLAMPEFCGEPDGAVSLDWIASKSRLLSVSVNGTPRLAYAWVDGGNRGHGVEVFNGRDLPAALEFCIRRILPHEPTSLRVA